VEAADAIKSSDHRISHPDSGGLFFYSPGPSLNDSAILLKFVNAPGARNKRRAEYYFPI